MPNEEELKSLKKYQENFDTKIIPTYDEIKQKRPSTASTLEEQKEISKERKKTLDKLLEGDNHRQKAEELLKKYKDNLSFSDDNREDVEVEFNEKISNLQNQIKDLENRQNRDSSLEKDHKYKKELERLKKELEGLKKKNQKTSPTSPERKNGNFPYGLVIGGIALIIVLLLVFFFFSQKRTNK
ncbi:MAG: hypothetical protein NY202_03970 [Mollicutes bacterium UO1]